eukprot:1144140-Pelagomonas_calceolata.AAC.2
MHKNSIKLQFQENTQEALEKSRKCVICPEKLYEKRGSQKVTVQKFFKVDTRNCKNIRTKHFHLDVLLGRTYHTQMYAPAKVMIQLLKCVHIQRKEKSAQAKGGVHAQARCKYLGTEKGAPCTGKIQIPRDRKGRVHAQARYKYLGTEKGAPCTDKGFKDTMPPNITQLGPMGGQE